VTRARPPGELRPVGRDRELAQLEDVVAGAAAGPRFVVVTGEPGIGKTTVWRAALELHRRAGHHVVATRPAEEELHGPLTGLFDLFEDADGGADVLAAELDPLDRGRAVLAVLRAASGRAPVVVAVDDLQWLDAVSAHALRYALRRLGTEPVILLATQRRDEPAGDVTPPGRMEEIALAPLERAAIDEIVHRAVGALPSPALGRIADLAGGNPLFAIELARRPLAERDLFGPASAPTLRTAMAARLAALPQGTLGATRTSAALGPATSDLLERACRMPSAATAIADGLAAGVLVRGDDGLVRVAHPLLASVVLDGLNPLARRDLHADLARLASDPDARARHLALSRSEADEEAAAELEAAAERAGRRGAAAVGAELAEHSVRLTPPDEVGAWTRRSLTAMALRASAGEPERASAAADELLARVGPGGRARLEAITLRVFLDIDHGEDVLRRELDDVVHDRWWRGRLLELLGWLLGTYRGALAEAVALGDQALAVARADGDADLEMLAAATLATSALLAGEPRPGLIESAMELGQRHEPPRLGRWPPLFLARHCLWGGDLARARELFESMRAAFSARGVEFQRPYRLSDLALVEIAAGALTRAEALLDDALEAAHDAGNRQAAVWHDYPAGLAALHRGRHLDAATCGTELLGWGRAHDQPPRRLMGHHVLGLDALARGDAAVAIAELDAGLELAARFGYRHPGFVAVLPDALEARALVGDATGCADLVAELAAQAAALGVPWVDAASARARGIGLLVAGDDAAATVLGAAADRFDALGYRLDAARTRLLQGRALRRAGRRGAAAGILGETEAALAAMGAEPWRAQAQAERGRLVRTHGGGLTATEQRVADLVVRGRRNREIAGELYVSVATVEAHLTRIYRKLGVRSRTELTRVLRAVTDVGDDAAGA